MDRHELHPNPGVQAPSPAFSKASTPLPSWTWESSPGPGPQDAKCVYAKSLQLCPTLCDPMDCSPPGSSVHGFLQAGILEWVAMPSSRGSSRLRDQTHVSYVSCIGRQVPYR